MLPTLTLDDRKDRKDRKAWLVARGAGARGADQEADLHVGGKTAAVVVFVS
jgi:hypothetical protein